MKYKIVVDSCCDLPDETLKLFGAELAPLRIQVGDVEVVDDLSFDQKNLLRLMKASKVATKTSCPSPNAYLELYKGADAVFVVTLSDQLSGSYNSAMIAKEMAESEGVCKYVHVCNSLAASSSQVLIAYMLKDLIDQEVAPEKIAELIDAYIMEQKTMFVLESLENLIRAGRISNTEGLIANLLSIKPLMGANKKGEIVKIQVNRGMKKSLNKLVEEIGKTNRDLSQLRCGISHCNCPERAEELKKKIAETYNFKEIIVAPTRGIASVYAYDGGVVVSY
ncbi:MAG: DegV family protein [Clostridia bacterium]|nr:DegV family protein [Clostridia bacterium]